MANNNQIYKMSNAGGFKSLTRYYDMLAGNTVWNPWEPQGAYDALATVTVPSGGAASVEFVGIPTGYKHLQVRAITAKSGGASDAVYVRFNSDSGSNYSQHRLYGDGSSATAYGTGSTTAALELVCMGTSSTNFGTFVLDALDYTSTNKNKTVRALAGQDKNGSGQIMLGSGAWLNTSAITSITFIGSSATIAQYSSFALFGVK